MMRCATYETNAIGSYFFNRSYFKQRKLQKHATLLCATEGTSTGMGNNISTEWSSIN